MSIRRESVKSMEQKQQTKAHHQHGALRDFRSDTRNEGSARANMSNKKVNPS